MLGGEAALDTTISGPAASTELSTPPIVISRWQAERGANLPPSPHIFVKKKKVDSAAARAQRRLTFY